MTLTDITKYRLIKVDSLIPADWNYKVTEGPKHDFLVGQLVNNFKRNGQVENIIVRLLDTGFYEVVNGNHRLEAAKICGMSNMICYDLGKVSLAEAKRLAAETNETKFDADAIKYAELIKEIHDEFGLSSIADTLALTKDEIQNKLDLLGFDWDMKSPEEDRPSQEEEPVNKLILYIEPEIGAQLFEQIDRFKKALYPEEKNLESISNNLPVQAMVQQLAQIPDEALVIANDQ